jgi:apolipoprotein N-acyltransferase
MRNISDQDQSRKRPMLYSLFLILISAVLYGLSFPPFSLSLVMWVALVPFFIVVATERPRSAAAYGVLWGMTMTCSFGWSFPQLVVNYFGLSLFLGCVLLGAVSLVLFGVYFGALAAWLSWCSHRRSLGPWLVAAGWCVCEFARANLWIGNPLALASYSQVSSPRVIQIADFSGPYGIGILIAAVNAGLAGWLVPKLRGQHWRLSWIGIAGAVAFTLLYGTWRLAQTFTSGEPFQVAIVQGAIPRELRSKPRHWNANLAQYLDLSRQAAEAKPAVIFWPENAVDFSLQRDSVQQQAVLQASQDIGAELVLGGPYFRYGVDDLYNRNAVFVVRDGKISGRYDKLRLLPFAEQDWFGWFRPPNSLLYEPGRHLHILRTSVARIGTLVCFEALYPDLVRQFPLRGAQILANPSNDDWFGYAAPAQHLLDIVTLRAIENRRYVARSTTTGFSAVIDPYGRIVAQSGFGRPEIIIAAIATSQTETLYQRWGDLIAWISIAMVSVVSFAVFIRQYLNSGKE